MTSSPSRIARTLAGAGLAIAVSVGFSACTQDPNRLPPTIGGGVNTEVGDQHPVKVLNLMVITRDGTTGFLEGVVTTSQGDDQLLGVSGELIDGSNNPSGAPLTIEGGPTPVTANVMTQLSVGSPYTVTGEIPAGLTARLLLVFANAGEVSLDVPIIDGNNVDYASVSPQPTSSL